MVDSVMLRCFKGDAPRGNMDAASGMAVLVSQGGSGLQADRFSLFTPHPSPLTLGF